MKLVVTSLALLLAASATAQSTAPTIRTTRAARPAVKSNPSTAEVTHSTAIVIDTHADTPGRFVDENFDPSNDAGRGHWDLAKVKTGNLGAEFFSIWVDPVLYKEHPARRALDMIDAVQQTVAQHPKEMVMATSSREIISAHGGARPRLASLMGVEGGHAIEGDIRVLRDFYRLGVRYMTLTWSNSNELGQSSGDLKTDANGKLIDPGLTDFGREVVREMNRMGMMVDISHVSDRTFYNTLVVSRAPVIASHSSSRAITNHPRNMTDDMLVALARNGGVAQVNFNCGFISNEYLAAAKAYEKAHPVETARANELESAPETPAIRAEREKLKALKAAAVPRPPLKALIDHFDHMIQVAGIDHVGIGSDFDGVECTPEGIDGVQDLPKITAELLKRGYSPGDVRKVLGGNLLHVFAEVERVSHNMQNEQNTDSRPEVAIPQSN